MRARSLLPLLVAAAAFCAAGCPPPPPPPEPVDRTDPADWLKPLEEPQGTWHTIAKGDTFFGLARRYGVPVASIAAANPQVDPKKLYIGTKVMIPGTAPVGPSAKPLPARPVGSKPPSVKTADRGGKLCYPVNGQAADVKSPAPGINFSAAAGSTVVSAAGGTVVLAAPDLGGLGPTVIVDHGNGLCTLYGKLSDYAVNPGQKLSRGEALGRCGASGLVFRVYVDADAVSPRTYLSK